MMSQLKKIKTRNGFSLVELIVVLFILVGLAALIVPTVTDLVGRTRASTAASSINAVANAIQRYEVQYLTSPNNYDSLVTAIGIGTDLDTLDPLLNNLVTPIFANVTLTPTLRAPLTAAGITSLGVHAVGANSFVRATPTVLADNDVINGLTVLAQQALGLEGTGVLNKYVVLGVGTITDMKGRTMMEPPVAFPGEGPINPNTAYRRYLAVYQITDGTDPLLKAKIVAVIAPDGKGLAGELADYFRFVSIN